ncbi:MAG: Na-K-Cl cotransporter [Deltaproteobacteria bacterium]|nr:Na-K-Cl cotransporter [Deltaproteobacteria bacterium]
MSEHLKRFGTFGGVFVPNFLTIIGVIFFLRAGWMVGNTGFVGGLLLVCLANSISVATALSLSAIATNMHVKAGGAYYLVSRSLGLEIGGSIGLPLYFSQALSVALYIMGFTESLVALMPFLPERIVSAIVCVGLLVLAYKGADVALKAQYIILGLLGLALLSFFTGSSETEHELMSFGTYAEGHDFWSVFAIYFPAVTGIMAGLSMSGDLKEPKKNIPRGTLAAVGVTFAIYLFQVYWFCHNADLEQLRSDNMIIETIASLGFLIYIGIWAATLSSALGSLVAAPRTMQALAADGVLPAFLGRGTGPANEPRTATLATFLIAEASILLVDLDMLAPVITMFFLTTYGVTNLVAGMERVVGNPSFRPRFRVHWAVSLLGAAGCFWVMFLINAQATVIALAIVAVIYAVLKRRSISGTWGDLRSGIWFAALRFCLLKLEQSGSHPRNWKPNLMVFSAGTASHAHLLELAGWLGQEKGLTTIMTLLPGDVHAQLADGSARQIQEKLDVYLEGRELTAFAKAVAVEDFYEGARVVAQSHGIGALRSNLALFGWSDSETKAEVFASLVRDFVHLKTSVILLKHDEQRGFGRRRQIDVWWGGLEHNGSLMVLLAHMVSLSDEWRGCKVRLLQVATEQGDLRRSERELAHMLEDARIRAMPCILPPCEDGASIQEVIRRESAAADLVVLGLRFPEPGREREFMGRMTSFMQDLPTTLLVRSVDIEDIFS